MTSSVCHRFVQNAWKKERCSNCFKPKDEHASLKRETPVTRRPLTLTTSSNNNKSRGIIKNPERSIPNRRKRAVSFKQELSEIIGFGGEDWGEGEIDEEEQGEDRLSEVRIFAFLDIYLVIKIFDGVCINCLCLTSLEVSYSF